MTKITWSGDKKAVSKKQRGVCFEDVEVAISSNRLLDVLPHHNLEKYLDQKVFVVKIRGYVYYVPFAESGNEIF